MEMYKSDAEEILKKPYERVLIPEEEDGGFSVYIQEFEGCIAQGETADEALRNLHDTAIEWIQAELEDGKEIPEAWNLQEFSGKFLLRFPKGLHQQLTKLASKEGVSLNQYLVSKLSAATGEEALLAALDKRLGQTRIFEKISHDIPPVESGVAATSFGSAITAVNTFIANWKGSSVATA